ncbi:glutamate--tRNA ligase [Mycoplasmatota bacterium]|nr:glutamate--tRNA ligase [Mycoplasmatota bacterium]
MKVRVRYAPSPTGYLHIGNTRTALFNFLYAKKHGGDFIVRIEDTDVERNVSEGEQSQLRHLKWLGIDYDESVDKANPKYAPYRQLERLDIYKRYAMELVERGLAYKCYCTEEELAKEREELSEDKASHMHYSRRCLNASSEELKELEKRGEYTIRFQVPENVTYVFKDIVKGEVSFSSEDIGDWVIMKRNGIPTYNFAVVIDDHLMDITHVLRGEEHITNTPKQMGIYDAFGWDYPTFGHMTLIVKEDGKKLSKRDPNIIAFISQYEKMGYLPEALFNFISLLGWSPEGEEEILSKAEIIDKFDEKRLSKSPATFDKNKLMYINNRYIKELLLENMVTLCKPHIDCHETLKEKSTEWITKLVGLFHDRMSFGAEIISLYHEFFEKDFVIDEEELTFIKQDGVKTTLEVFKLKLEELTEFNTENIKKCIKMAGKETKAKGKLLYMPCRIATTSQMHGPDLPKVIELLGKVEVINRLEKTLALLPA